MKIQAAPDKYLHFCGLKVWNVGGGYVPRFRFEGEPLTFKEENVYMSSMWNDARMIPWNPVKTLNWNANWGGGEFTCVHTLNEE